MKTAVGVYSTHEKAIQAIAKLKDAGYPVTHLSILGRAETEEVIDTELHLEPKYPIKLGGLEAGTALGVTLGILTGVGVFAIPGFGFLYGAGAVIGAIAGFDMGLIGGGIATVLETLGIKDAVSVKYKALLEQGKYLLIVKGPEDEVTLAKGILSENNIHDSLEIH